MLYIKDGKIKDSSEIVIIVDDFQIINPSEEQILADGWLPYTPPPVDEQAILARQTEYKVKEMFFKANVPTEINTYGLSNNEALSIKEYFPTWKENIEVKEGERYQYSDKLYEVLQGHTTQANWKPDVQSSLWVEVAEAHDGTLDDPIPYNEEMNPMWQGMILEEGKYYTQNGVVYKCIRGTGNKVTHNLADLVSGGFVEQV